MITQIANTMVKRARLIIGAGALIAGCAAALTDVSRPIDDAVESIRRKVMTKTASGDVVIVAIDDESLAEVQDWPWPRSVHGRMVDRLTAMGAAATVMDISFLSDASDVKQDEMLARALEKSSMPVSIIGSIEYDDDKRVDMMPISRFATRARTVSGFMSIDARTGEFGIPYSGRIGDAMRPSIASVLAGRDPSRLTGNLTVDWSIDYDTIPVLSYADVLEGRIPKSQIKGKMVLIGATASGMGDRWADPSGRRVPGVIMHGAAAETLKRGVPRHEGPWTLLAIAGLMTLLAGRVRNRMHACLAIAVSMPAVVGIDWLVRETSTIMTVGPAMATMITGIVLQAMAAGASAMLTRITTDDITDLPNMTAMRIDAPKGPSTVVIRVRNYLDTTAALGHEMQAELLRRVRDRIRLASADNAIYQVDAHSFAWRTQQTGAALSECVEGLSALFASGIAMDGRVVDAPIAAGIVDDSKMDVDAAVVAALLAADHAVRQGLPWTRHEDTAAEAEWRMTIMGEVDRSITAGDIWVAYQPKYDIAGDTIKGAEALVRWTHPERGHVRPDHFIPILEEAGRIDRLTMHVLETSIRDFSDLGDLTVAVNLSTRMLGRDVIVGPVRDLLAKYGMAPSRLILEITESAALSGDMGVADLAALRDMGVGISIDDYGTGQSTLNYLKVLPATELKIDQSFVRVVNTSRSDNVMIASTIGLAHALGLTVVAEGVETADVLEALVGLDCDVIQGYHIGRPVPLADYVKTVATQLINKPKAA